MLQICPKLPRQKFKDPPFKEEILSFIRDLGHTGEIKVLSDVNVNHLHQPWRSFGMYHNKNVDYVYLVWEDLVYQVENKNSKKNNDMYYPCFTKVIVDYFMVKDRAIPKRNKMFWHYAKDDLMFTTIRVISKHQDTQVALTEAEQMKIALERSKIQTRSSHDNGSGVDEGTGITPGVPDVPTYESDAEQISWKSSDEEDDCYPTSMHNDNDDNDDDNNDDNDDDTENQDDDDQEHNDQDD
ncbi:hypothetical protein Tco_1383801 [Tanacetum coccineum]